jgi:hypothetical protein
LRDAGLDAAAWDHAETILPSGALGNKFSFRVNGLEPGLEYSYRLHIESASGEEYWAPGAGRFRVLTELENLKLNLRVTEVNYHPGNPRKAEIQAGFVSDDDFEFIEFYNRGSEPLDLVDVSVQGEIRFSFREHALISQIPAGGFLLVTRERGAFQARYGREPLVAGQWCNPNSCKKLSNAGGTVSLVYREHEVFWTLTYDDEKKWPGQADGDGPTLELIDVSRPVENHEDPGAWRASQDPLGSPGFHAGIPATEFADWMKEAYPLEPDIDPFMPSERDGVPPVIRYALALDVTGRSFAESLLRVSLERLNGGQGLELSPVATVVLRGGLNSEQSGVYFGVEVSTDLIRWESQPLTEIENTVRPDGARTVRVRLPPARVDAPEMFVRLAFRLSPDP